MSIDTTFKPFTNTWLVGTSAVNIPEASSMGAVTFRILNNAATPALHRLTWGLSASVVSAGAPTAGVPVHNTVAIPAGAVIYLDLPAPSFFIGDASSAFEITGGQGGIGG